MAAKSRIGMAAGALLALCTWLGGDSGLTAARAAVTLYDGSLGTAPAAQGWIFIPGGPAAQSVGGGAVTLDTRALIGTQAGYGRFDQVLDSSAGVEVSFRAQLVEESHDRDSRAGFSVIVIDHAARGVELGFWPDRVFAQNAAFTHGEEVLFNTGTMNQYRLRLTGAGYDFSVSNGSFSAGLHGALRDYSCSGNLLCTLVYNRPNRLFFGDDTTSAAASFRLASVSVAPVPEPPQVVLMGIGFLLVMARLARRRASA